MKYTCYIVEFKNIPKKGKVKKREVIKINFFNDLSFDLAKHIITRKRCGIRFLDINQKPCLKDKAYKAIGYDGHNLIAFAIPKRKSRSEDYVTDLSIYPKIPFHLQLDKNIIFNWEKIELLIENYEDNFFDYSIEGHNIWGPKSLIPKGYYHVDKGFIQEGDYYFDDNSSELLTGHWTSVDISFSPCKPNKEISLKGCLYQGKHKGREENESLKYYNHFIIRKIES